jgi:hypothetical protein
MQASIPRLVPRATLVMKPIEKRREHIQVLKSLQILLANRPAFGFLARNPIALRKSQPDLSSPPYAAGAIPVPNSRAMSPFSPVPNGSLR